MTLYNHIIFWAVLVAAAILEVGGDAAIRKGVQSSGLPLIASGFLVLGFYGVVVNLLSGPTLAPGWVKSFLANSLGGVKLDLSRLLGVYVTIFALVSVLWGRFLLKEYVPGTTWIGLAIVLFGGMVIQYGQKIFG